MEPELSPRVLLVDDRPDNLLALRAVLDPLGYDLVEAASGEEALRRLLSEEFAVIVLDVQMPVLDGFETARLIKGRERTRHVPIIFLTAISGEPEHYLRGYETGAVDYVYKPFEPEILRAKVAVLTELWVRGATIERQRAELAAVPGHRRKRPGGDGRPGLVEVGAQDRFGLEESLPERDRLGLELLGRRPGVLEEVGDDGAGPLRTGRRALHQPAGLLG